MTDLKLSKQDYEQFGREFLDFYLEHGFGNKSKTDIDRQIYSLLYSTSYLDKNMSNLAIAKKLKITKQKVKTLEENRFFCVESRFDDVKEPIIDALKRYELNRQNCTIKITTYNVSVKLYIESLLQENNLAYDYSFNSNNIVLNLKAFSCILNQFSLDYSEILKNIKEEKIFEESFTVLEKEIKKETGSNFYSKLLDFAKKQGVEVLSSVVSKLITSALILKLNLPL